MDLQERAKVCDLIEAVVGADGVVTDAEREFLRRVVTRFGLSPDERADRIMASDPGRATTILRTLSPEDQPKVMALLVDAATADGQVSPDERALLLASAAALGIDAGLVEDRIAKRLRASAVPT